jgi:ABC-type uncharacterized transport system ATPase subunit
VPLASHDRAVVPADGRIRHAAFFISITTNRRRVLTLFSLPTKFDGMMREGVTLAVPQGCVLGLLGHNGADKTTLVNILATLLQPSSGRTRVTGFDVVRSGNVQLKRGSRPLFMGLLL